MYFRFPGYIKQGKGYRWPLLAPGHLFFSSKASLFSSVILLILTFYCYTVTPKHAPANAFTLSSHPRSYRVVENWGWEEQAGFPLVVEETRLGGWLVSLDPMFFFECRQNWPLCPSRTWLPGRLIRDRLVIIDYGLSALAWPISNDLL